MEKFELKTIWISDKFEDDIFAPDGYFFLDMAICMEKIKDFNTKGDLNTALLCIDNADEIFELIFKCASILSNDENNKETFLRLEEIVNKIENYDNSKDKKLKSITICK